MPTGMPRGLSSWVAALGCACQSHAVGDRSQSKSPSSPPSSSGVASATAARGPTFGSNLDPPRARSLRRELVDRIASTRQVGNEAVLQAMRDVPRHLFANAVFLDLAYADRPLPIGFGQTISQPTIVAIMTDALELSGNERVLEIGTGSGYQAAVLSLVSKEVYSIEVIPDLGHEAAERLRRLGYANVRVHVGDGYTGWPQMAPFDRIIVTAAPPSVPQTLLSELSDDGILVAPIGREHGEQTLYRFRKRGGSVEQEDLGSVRFVPMVAGD